MTPATKGLLAIGVLALAGIAYVSYTGARAPGASHAALQTAAASDGKPVNACALLTQAEVAATVGAEVAAGERRDDGEVGGMGDFATPGTYSSTCFWRFVDTREENPDLPMGGHRFVILNAMVWPKDTDAHKFLQSFHDAFKEDLIPSDPVMLENLGDEALWWGDGTAVRKNAKSFGVSVFLQNGDKPTQKKMEEALARKVAGRL